MHCFIWFIATGALWSVVAAATTRPNVQPAVVQRGYQEQDTARAFYSYGYSDENAARAEYSSRDGSSRGFYSYVDANGQLQTVKYEAGGLQGFKAVASNQPKAPVDNQKPPLPVTDTVEVQQARQAHLSAIRDAQEQARAEQTRVAPKDEQPLSDEDAAILERVRAELSSMLAERQRQDQNPEADESSAKESEERVEQQQKEQREEEREREREQSRQLTSDANDLRLRTVYSLADISSSSYLKLSDLEERLDRQDGQELRVPVSAYYSYVSPESKYSVTTPTVLRSVRPVALSRSLILSKRN